MITGIVYQWDQMYALIKIVFINTISLTATMYIDAKNGCLLNHSIQTFFTLIPTPMLVGSGSTGNNLSCFLQSSTPRARPIIMINTKNAKENIKTCIDFSMIE